MKRARLALIVIVALLAAAWLWWPRTSSDSLQLSGNVDIRELNLAFRVGGRLEALAVDEGARVKRGQLLARLDAAPYRIARDEAQAALDALLSRQQLLHKGQRLEDVLQANARAAALQATLKNAEANLARIQRLAAEGAIEKRALDDAQAARDATASQLEAARQQALSLQRGFRREEIAEGDANRRRAEAQLAAARLQLSDATLVAPADGIILTRAVEPGGMLATGNTVYTLSLDRPVRVRAYVAEPQLGRVPPGTRVEIRRDGRAQPYHGAVGFVSPTAEFTPKNVETQDLRTALVYRLRIEVSDADDALRQGMPVTVTLAEKP